MFKFPFLLVHFWHHRQEDKSLTLINFFSIHYSENHPPDHDDDEDNQLPFKSGGNICHIDTMPATIKEGSEKTFVPPSVKLNIPYEDKILSHKSFSIFHPPRLS